ncbi:MAG: TPR end-of-group domain-containing protein [Kofleriaceae bacterium]
MELIGLEPRRSDLARGIVVARSARPLDPAAQRALWELLAKAGVTEAEETRERTDEERELDEVERQWLAAPWMPPSATEVDAQRAAFEQAAAEHGLEVIWCVKIETGIDGVAWLELAETEPIEETDETEPEPGDAPEIVDGIFDEKAEVLYSAPDAPAPPPDADDPEAEDLPDDDELEEELQEADISGVIESHWRNGTPPFEHNVPFPVERFPEMIDDYDWESFGIAVKLSGPQLPGEESVVNAFFALWLSAYQDERADEFEPFQRADVVHDRKHRSALMWAERFAVPATATDQVHFLLWIVARVNDILPLTWARFDSVDDAVKSRAITDDGSPPFILAGNPFAERFRRHGEEAALAWAVGQSAWSRRELAGMLIEVALEHDPDEAETAVVAERLLRRALSFDSASDATGYLGIVLVRQQRTEEAVTLAREATRRDVRLLVVGESAEHAPDGLGAALELLDDETLRGTDPEEVAELVGSIARHAPDELDAVLARLPDIDTLVPYLYNTSFTVERTEALAILRRVLALPVPTREAGEARTALVMAWNNACIHAHALGNYRLAVDLADGGQPYATENPYIYHSAACAYAAVGEIDRAIEQVELAIEHEYEHSEKMETDSDLAPLQSDPRFSQLFREWRTRRADLN